ncbi:hypothetical protein [Streptomyces sp. KR80]|uniref:hypothetical protein n=1 Tax=Streptomyces sp. KR80 TaxID=3457426 RepID=UPI003FD50B5A
MLRAVVIAWPIQPWDSLPIPDAFAQAGTGIRTVIPVLADSWHPSPGARQPGR